MTSLEYWQRLVDADPNFRGENRVARIKVRLFRKMIQAAFAAGKADLQQSAMMPNFFDELMKGCHKYHSDGQGGFRET
jgi:hypothetical protein